MYNIKIRPLVLLKGLALWGLWFGLQGCASVAPPTYPSDLQSIIAKNVDQPHASHGENSGEYQGEPPPNGGNEQALTVAQLLDSVRGNGQSAVNQVPSFDEPNGQWIFTGDATKTQQKTTGEAATQQSTEAQSLDVSQVLAVALAKAKGHSQASTQPVDIVQADVTTRNAVTSVHKTDSLERQLQLNYQADALLPNAMQLMMAKQLAGNKNMRLVGLLMGPCAGESRWRSASNAHKRATRLVQALAAATDSVDPVIDYQPTLAADVVIVTFKHWGS